MGTYGIQERPDLLAGFTPLLTGIRWGTVGVALVVNAANGFEGGDLAWAATLVAYAALRTFRPLSMRGDDLNSLLQILGEVSLNLCVVISTGLWSSPYVICLATAITAAGLGRGFGFAIRMALIAILALFAVTMAGDRDLDEGVQWAPELLLIGLVAGWSRRLFGEAEERHMIARQANDLLAQLNDVARTMPASLDLGDVADQAVTLTRRTAGADVVALLLHDELGGTWSPSKVIGARLLATRTTAQLPRPMAEAAVTRQTVVATEDLLGERTSHGVYAPVQARGRLVGLLAAEGPKAIDPLTIERIADEIALAVDNARWFERLRTVGADEERTRIARELHDRVGQSLAFVSFELERIGRQAAGEPVADDLQRLHHEVRNVVTEVRDTLYDLRTDVSERDDLVAIVHDFADRMTARTGTPVVVHADASGRIPLRQEREMWRIAQEAIVNACKHAEATKVEITWRSDGRTATLEVTDDGKGIDGDGAKAGSYGLVGMRERAAAIGATLAVDSATGQGTRIVAELGR